MGNILTILGIIILGLGYMVRPLSGFADAMNQSEGMTVSGPFFIAIMAFGALMLIAGLLRIQPEKDKKATLEL